jgi:hypothetical protein
MLIEEFDVAVGLASKHQSGKVPRYLVKSKVTILLTIPENQDHISSVLQIWSQNSSRRSPPVSVTAWESGAWKQF